MNDRLRALLVLVAIFLLGCMVGAACFLVWGGRVVAARGSHAGEPYARGPQRLAERLHLSSDQEVRVREILTESRKQMNALRTELAPRFAAIREDTDKKISALLNEEQKKQFAEFRKEMESRRERMSHRPDMMPPPPGR